MTDNNNENEPPQPFQPPERGAAYYKNLRREATAQRLGAILADITTPTTPDSDAVLPPDAVSEVTAKPQTPRRRIMDLNINIDLEEGETMDEPHMLLQMAFKPHVTGLKLSAEQSQLILAYLHEILAEAEIEEQAIVAEQAMLTVQNTDDDSRNQGGDTSDNNEIIPCK